MEITKQHEKALADKVRALPDSELAALGLDLVLGGSDSATGARRPKRAANGVDHGAPQAATDQGSGSAPRRKAGRVGAGRGSGQKRSPDALADLTERVFSHIKANSGQGVEQITKALGTTTKELTLPIRKLLANKRITSLGQKRSTRYFTTKGEPAHTHQADGVEPQAGSTDPGAE